MARPKPYTFVLPATVHRHKDGDGFWATATVYPWPVMSVQIDVRLAGLNARESEDPGGPEAAAALAALIPVGSMVLLTLLKRDEYGRAVCAVTRFTDGLDISARMIADGWAAPWDGRGEKPVPVWPRPQDVAA